MSRIPVQDGAHQTPRAGRLVRPHLRLLSPHDPSRPVRAPQPLLAAGHRPVERVRGRRVAAAPERRDDRLRDGAHRQLVSYIGQPAGEGLRVRLRGQLGGEHLARYLLLFSQWTCGVRYNTWFPLLIAMAHSVQFATRAALRLPRAMRESMPGDRSVSFAGQF